MKKTLSIGLFAAAVLPVSCSPVQDRPVPPVGPDNGGSERPLDRSNLNFLIIMADQVQWNALGISGNPHIKTPVLDRMASDGAYFSQAVCPVPVSGPSRSCMLTGMLMEKTKIQNNGQADDGTSLYPSYDEILAADGYHVEFIGKFHSPMNMMDVYRNPEQKGMRGRELIRYWQRLYRMYLSDHYQAPEIKPGELLLSEGFYNNVPYEPNPLDKRYEALLSGNYTPKELRNMKFSQPDCNGTLQLDDDLSVTAFQARETIDALRRNKGRKFAISCSFHSPHAPMLPTPRWRDMYDAASLPVPESISDDMSDNPYKNGNGRPANPQYSDPEKVRLMTADYYALVTEVDHWIGEILKTLKAEGLDKNTVVVFLADHGEMLGAHGMREKNNFLEESVRVPFIITAPGMTPVDVKTPVSCINLFQTILDYAGVEGKSDGFSLRPLIDGEEPSYDFCVSEWEHTNINVPNLMIRTSKWKLMVNIRNMSGSCDALYDLENDPHELVNLIHGGISGQYDGICKELMENLYGYLLEREYPYMKEFRTKYTAMSL